MRFLSLKVMYGIVRSQEEPRLLPSAALFRPLLIVNLHETRRSSVVS